MGGGASKTNQTKEVNGKVLNPKEVEKRRNTKFDAKKRVMMMRMSLTRYEGYEVVKSHDSVKELVDIRRTQGHEPYQTSAGYLETLPYEIMDLLGDKDDNDRQVFKDALAALIVEESPESVSKANIQLEMLIKGANERKYVIEQKNDPSSLRAPAIHSFADWKTDKSKPGPPKNKKYKQFHDKAIKALKDGELCFQVFTAGVTEAFREALREAGQEERPMYVLDPWELADNGVIMADVPKSPLKGLQFGSRIMLNLALALRQIGCQDQCHVVVHLNSEVEQRVLEDLLLHKFFGFKPDKVIFVSQPRMPGFSYNADRQRLMAFNESRMRFYGTGYAMMQLSWQKEAYRLTRGGQRKYIQDSVLNHLESLCGVKWLYSTACNDMYTYEDPHLLLDLDRLAFTMHLCDSKGMNMTTEVDCTGWEGDLTTTAGMAAPGKPEGCGRVVPLNTLLGEGSLAEAAEKANSQMNMISGKSGASHDLPVGLLRCTVDIRALRANMENKPLPVTLEMVGVAVYPTISAYDVATLDGMKCGLISRGQDRFGCGELAAVTTSEQLSPGLVCVERQDGLPEFQALARSFMSKDMSLKTRPANVKPRLEAAVHCDGSPESYAVFDFLQTCVGPVMDRLHLLGFVATDATLQDVSLKNEVLLTYEPAKRGIDLAPSVHYMTAQVQSPAAMMLWYSRMVNKYVGVIGMYQAGEEDVAFKGVLVGSRSPILVVKADFQKKVDAAAKEEEDEEIERQQVAVASKGKATFQRSTSWSASKNLEQDKADFHNKAVLQRKRWAIATKGRNAEMSAASISLVAKLAGDLDEVMLLILVPDTSMPQQLSDLRKMKKPNSVGARKGKWAGNNKDKTKEEKQFDEFMALRDQLMAEYKEKQQARLRTIREVGKMEQLCVRLKLKYRKEEVVAEDFNALIASGTLDEHQIDVVVINAHPTDPNPAAISDEALSFTYKCPKSVLVFKGKKGEVAGMTEDPQEEDDPAPADAVASPRVPGKKKTLPPL